MAENFNFKKIEKNILKTAHQHGFIDLIFGFLLLGMGFFPFFYESLPSPYKYFLWQLIVVFISLVSTFYVTKYIIQPRTGVVKPGPSIKSIRKKLFILVSIQLLIELILLILLFTGSGSGSKVSEMIFMLITGLLFIPTFAIMGFLMKFPRLYLIGLLIWLANFINALLYDSMDWVTRSLLSYGIIGAVIFLMGLALFIRFLKRYPLPKEERTQ
ncbi:MAG: hypothetical protein ACFFCE_15945 [Promethearchaeota archaeon]